MMSPSAFWRAYFFDPMKKLVIFDLNGTLIDSLDDLALATNHMLRMHNLPLHEPHEYRAMMGHGVRTMVRRALPNELGDDDAYLDACLSDFRTYYTAHLDAFSRPYPGVVDLLKELNSRGIKVAVVSNKCQKGVEYLLVKFFSGIDFVAVMGKREGFPPKLAPENLNDLLLKTHLTKEQVVMVSDSLSDMQRAANVGIDAIAVSWGYRTKEEHIGNKIVDSVEQLRKILIFASI